MSWWENPDPTRIWPTRDQLAVLQKAANDLAAVVANYSPECVMCGGSTTDDIGSIPMHRPCSEQAQDPALFNQPYPRRDVLGEPAT